MLKLPEERMRKISICQEDMPIGDIIFQITPLKKSMCSADDSSTVLPVTDLDGEPRRGADSNLHWYKKDDNSENNLLIIERKSFTDLLASIKDGRYEEQSHRLINTSGLPMHSIIYLLEGMFSQVLEKDKKLIMSTMASLNIFKGFSILRTSTIYETGEMLITFADKIVRDMEKGRVPHHMTSVEQQTFPNEKEEDIPTINNVTHDSVTAKPPEQQNYCNYVKKVKKENITPENIGEIILSQIPGISSVTAISIMKKFSTFPKFIEELKNNPQCLEDIVTESNGKTRKISKSSIENIRKFLCE